MAEKMVALSDIRHGTDDGIKTFRRGETVTGLDKDTMQTLIESGSVGEEKELPERRQAPGEPSEMEQQLHRDLADRDAEIVELRRQLQAKDAELAANRGNQSGANTGTAKK